MVKVPMNTADVAAEAKCLRRLIGMRCSNVYDLSPKEYMFKLMKSSGVTESGESEKVLLLMESGVRFHTTAYVGDKSTTPSGFALKLRKHIRSKRLEDVRLLGYDRSQRLTQGNGDLVRGKKLTLKSVLGEALGYGPTLAEHIILEACLNPHMKLGDESKLNITDETIQVLATATAKFEDWLSDIICGEEIPKVYEDYCPILLNHFKSKELVGFETIDAALDEFYSKIESQMSEEQLFATEESAAQRLNKIRADQENHVNTLRIEVNLSTTMAELIEDNLDGVDAALVAVRVALANGMDWEDFARMIKEEKESGNPVAGLIDKLHFERNCITLLLSNNLNDMDDDERHVLFKREFVLDFCSYFSALDVFGSFVHK